MNKILIIIGSLLLIILLIDLEVLNPRMGNEKIDAYAQKKVKGFRYLVLLTKEGNEYRVPNDMDGLIVDSNSIISARTFLFNWKKSISYRINGKESILNIRNSLNTSVVTLLATYWIISVGAFIIFFSRTKPKYQYLYERFIGLGFVLLLLLFISFFIAY